MAEFVDHLVGYADHVEVDDLTARAAGDDIDDAGEERVVAVASHDDTSDGDPVRALGLVEDRPHLAGRVDLVDVSGK